MGIVYKITNLINGKIYVGQTINSIERRFYQHCHSKHTVIGRAINKHGAENFTIEQLSEEDDLNRLSKKEADWIEQLNAIDKNIGYNVVKYSPGHGPHDQSTKDKISKANKGKPAWNKNIKMSPHQISLMSERMKGKTSAFKGRKFSEKSIKQISESQKKTYISGRIHHMQGKHHSDDTKLKIKQSVKKRAVQGISIKDGSIIFFESTKAADRAGYFFSGIKANITGKIKSAYKGYKWRFVDGAA
jgi:group I intron endonuclease